MNHPAAGNPGLLLIISGPSGVGKTTITHHVEKQLGAQFSISITTRPQTASDTEGHDYFFVNQEQFAAGRDAGDLIEWAEVFGHYYGTPRRPVEQSLAEGRLVILEIDVAGAVQVKRAIPDTFALFVLPPNEQVLLERLRRRRREDDATIQHRFAKARDEIARARACGAYDEFLTNDELDQAVREATRLVRQELGRRRQAQRP